MMRVISSPSISTTGFATLIFAIADRAFLKVARTGRKDFRRAPYSTQKRMAKAAIFTSGALTFARRQFVSRPVCGIRLRPRAIVKPLIRQDKVNAAIARRLNAFAWRIDDRLFVY
jgi:hypothetical protein